MIDINLLPEALRRKERMPLQQMLALIIALLAVCGVGYLVAMYQMNIIPGLIQKKHALTGEQNSLKIQAEELARLNAEIAKLSEYVDTVKGLYRNRVVWAKILSDIKHIANFDTTMSEYNPDMRYLWFNKLTGRERKIEIEGFATASTQVLAMQLPERLIQGFLSYSPITLPEKDEEVRLQELLRTTLIEYDALRRESPDLPLQGPKEIEIRQRLEEIKNITSGGIAMLPFYDLMVPGSLQLVSVAWGSAPKPSRSLSGEASSEIFPDNAWAFKINMNIK
jgi:Tfp pilus assembly protein PilN